jgi:dimethylhistidine N-methyltransferase
MSLKTLQKELGYTKHILGERLSYYEPSENKSQKTFVQELSHSIRQKQKSINPKFFYDQKGSHLFEKICVLPEYYLTRTEISILKQIDGKLQSYLDGNFRLVELGSGSSQKTRLLIDILTRLQKRVEYFPIDVSKILKSSSTVLQSDYKKLHITGIIDNYENGLEFVKNYDDMKNLIVFLGSSFGNFDPENGIRFLKKINSSMKKGDLFLVGLDLVKDKNVLYQAYNDSQGITAQFNLNVLSRINSELGGNFDTSKFAHHAVYNENQNKIELFLRSLSKQTVEISNADLTLEIDEGELIHTENSHKYTISQIKQMFAMTGYKIKDMWNDDNRYYSLVLLSKNV